MGLFFMLGAGVSLFILLTPFFVRVDLVRYGRKLILGSSDLFSTFVSWMRS